MKKMIWTVAILSLAAGVLVGCGDSKDSNDNYDPYGYGYNGYGNYGQNPYDRRNGYNVYHNPNQVILAGAVEIINPGLYQNYLKGIGACLSYWSQTCSWVDDSPLLRVRIDDYKFKEGNSSRGTVEFMTQTGPAPYPVLWRMINNNTGFDTKVFGPVTTKSWNKPLQVKITGRSTDSVVVAEIFYNGKLMGQANLDRLNR